MCGSVLRNVFSVIVHIVLPVIMIPNAIKLVNLLLEVIIHVVEVLVVVLVVL